jgi:tetratricopeptide (TPR) repeat protein
MTRFRRQVGFLTFAMLVLAVTGAAAQEGWVQVATPNFTVVANGGDKRARDIALQFERYRAAIQSGWPWARPQLDRPVVVIAAKDEATMKLLVPQYWERGSRMQPASVFATAPDAYFIAVRSDLRDEDNQNSNPYQTSYWSYTMLALTSAFEHPLPLWFRNGFAAVLSNSLVRSDHIDFGRPIDEHLRTLQTGVRLNMTEFLTLDAKSRYYMDSATRPNFEAQSWAVLHYLLFGREDQRAVNELAKLLLEGKSSVDAVRQVFGSVEALDHEFVLYRRQQVFRYLKMNTPNTVSVEGFTTRKLEPLQVTAIRAQYHVATGRPADARKLVETLKGQSPVPAAVFDIEAVLLDREDKPGEARAMYARAAEANTDNFFSLYRLATLEQQPNPDAARLARMETLLRRSIASNNGFAPAHVFLANVLSSQNKAAEAVPIATRGAALDPSAASARLALARAFWGASKQGEARGQALAARALADSDQERAAVQALLEFFDRSTAAATTR